MASARDPFGSGSASGHVGGIVSRRSVGGYTLFRRSNMGGRATEWQRVSRSAWAEALAHYQTLPVEAIVRWNEAARRMRMGDPRMVKCPRCGAGCFLRLNIIGRLLERVRHRPAGIPGLPRVLGHGLPVGRWIDDPPVSMETAYFTTLLMSGAVDAIYGWLQPPPTHDEIVEISRSGPTPMSRVRAPTDWHPDVFVTDGAGYPLVLVDEIESGGEPRRYWFRHKSYDDRGLASEWETDFMDWIP